MCALFTACNFNLLPERQELEAIQITSPSHRDLRRVWKTQNPRTRLECTGPALRRFVASMGLARITTSGPRALKQDKVPTRNRCPSFGRSFARLVRGRGQGRAVHTSIGSGPHCRRARREKIASTPAPRSPALSCTSNTSVASRPPSLGFGSAFVRMILLFVRRRSARLTPWCAPRWSRARSCGPQPALSRRLCIMAPLGRTMGGKPLKTEFANPISRTARYRTGGGH